MSAQLLTKRQVIKQLRQKARDGYTKGRLVFTDETGRTVDIKEFSLVECWRSNGQLRSHVDRLILPENYVTVEAAYMQPRSHNEV